MSPVGISFYLEELLNLNLWMWPGLRMLLIKARFWITIQMSTQTRQFFALEVLVDFPTYYHLSQMRQATTKKGKHPCSWSMDQRQGWQNQSIWCLQHGPRSVSRWDPAVKKIKDRTSFSGCLGRFGRALSISSWSLVSRSWLCRAAQDIYRMRSTNLFLDPFDDPIIDQLDYSSNDKRLWVFSRAPAVLQHKHRNLPSQILIREFSR